MAAWQLMVPRAQWGPASVARLTALSSESIPPDLEQPTRSIGLSWAELAAIMVALDGGMAPGGRVPATDSKTSLHLIHRQLHDPISNRWSPRHELLVAIAARMSELTAGGHTTHLIKVKSHTGVSGKRRTGSPMRRDPSKCDLSVDVGSTAFQHVFWPGLLDPDRGSCRTVANL